ncbi:zf-TFIIB domain-containing protein [Uliginosibacterium sp. 31-12]|uniref:TFIIB-type zinc ribbon-containing protein n=1 Tax=Uliginosibacterium sp. 31-12 TaxID=3062781 RepID=UPI0026E2981D|nr:zf-TFIIB domain-containing protein [Uliginosibacterium sp. 31-12]MDO6386526.1 zf-TFIIB domain-containing protein [Uliginosibacterium sp. 31-12]
MGARVVCNCAPRAELVRVELAPGLPAQQCEACGGVLLGMADHRHWREAAAVSALPGEAAPALSDSPSARACPACTRLMQRYRAGMTPDFRVDHCPACQLVWLDKGEWQALAQAGLATRLGEIVSAAWQRRVQGDELRARREAGLRSKHGDACIDEIKRVREWLDGQAQRDELIALLRAGW